MARKRSRLPRPGEASLVLRMALWSLALPVLKRVVPVRTLARLTWVEGKVSRVEARERLIVRLSSVLPRLPPRRPPANCLERSLLAYRFLAQANADPRLVVGVARGDSGLLGHAWVLLDGRPVHEDEAALRGYVPVVEFGREGRATRDGQKGTVPDRWA